MMKLFKYVKNIEEKIKHHAKIHFIKYPLDMSMGYAICESAKDTMHNMIYVADKMLYQNKLDKLSNYDT